jgi:hypothetical protein
MLNMSDLVSIFGLGGQMVQEASSIQCPPPSDRQYLDFVIQKLKIALAVDDKFDCFG